MPKDVPVKQPEGLFTKEGLFTTFTKYLKITLCSVILIYLISLYSYFIPHVDGYETIDVDLSVIY